MWRVNGIERFRMFNGIKLPEDELYFENYTKNMLSQTNDLFSLYLFFYLCGKQEDEHHCTDWAALSGEWVTVGVPQILWDWVEGRQRDMSDVMCEGDNTSWGNDVGYCRMRRNCKYGCENAVDDAAWCGSTTNLLITLRLVISFTFTGARLGRVLSVSLSFCVKGSAAFLDRIVCKGAVWKKASTFRNSHVNWSISLFRVSCRWNKIFQWDTDDFPMKHKQLMIPTLFTGESFVFHRESSAFHWEIISGSLVRKVWFRYERDTSLIFARSPTLNPESIKGIIVHCLVLSMLSITFGWKIESSWSK